MRRKTYLLQAVPDGACALAQDQGDTSKGQLWRKELAYPGHFVKMGEGDEPEFELEVTEPLIDHWVKTFDDMKADGVDVPVPIGHTTEPEKRRGTVERLCKEPNEEGKPALFSYIRFSSPEYSDQFKDSNVSLFMPPKWTNGKGKTYQRPITHVAITDYPVIPKLGKFSSVAASYNGAIALSLSQEDEGMETTWEEVAKELGVRLEDGQDAREAVMQAWSAGETSPEGGSAEEDELGFEDDQFTDIDESAWDDLGTGQSRSPGGTREGQDADDARRARMAMAGVSNYDPPPSMGMSLAVPPTLAKREAKVRLAQLQELRKDCRINAQQLEYYKQRYCKPDNIAVAMSMEMQDPSMSDGWDATYAALSMATPFARMGEHTGPQQGAAGVEKSPVVIDAERRRAAAERGGR
jgi:hypothetical protein